MKKVVVIAPHPDDETLGCGGTLLRHIAEGDSVHWIIMTRGGDEQKRPALLKSVASRYGFASVEDLGFPSARTDALDRADLVQKLGEVFKLIQPEVLYLPFPGDIHTDHRVTFETAAACSKWFRYPSVQRVLAYETLSETEMALDPTASPFVPNVFVDTSIYSEKKCEILGLYGTELGEFPFPRSLRTVEARETFRGSSAGYARAEAFLLLRERIGK